MTTIINGSSPSVTFSDGTTQTTAALPLTGGTVTGGVNLATSSGNVGIGTASPRAKLDVSTNSTTNSNAVVIGPTAGSATVGDAVKLGFALQNTAGGSTGNTYAAAIGGIQSLSASNSGALGFYTQGSAGDGTPERMRIDSSGNLLVGTTSNPSSSKIVSVGSLMIAGNNVNSTAGAEFFFINGGDRYIVNHGTSLTSSAIHYYFVNPNGVVGSISTNGSTTAYNTSSDYRLKEDIAPMTGALAKVSALKPVSYKWKSDGSISEGFIAHELAEVVPDCVTGEKDAVDAEGKPVYQGIDTSFLVATLTAAIQELKAELDATKAEVQALKAK